MAQHAARRLSHRCLSSASLAAKTVPHTGHGAVPSLFTTAKWRCGQRSACTVRLCRANCFVVAKATAQSAHANGRSCAPPAAAASRSQTLLLKCRTATSCAHVFGSSTARRAQASGSESGGGSDAHRAANSRIRDVDVAQESADQSRNQVLLQAGTSVLAAANQAPQQALTLLG